MQSLTFSASTNCRIHHGFCDQLETLPPERLEAQPEHPSVWTETELIEAVLTVCDEIPAVRMVACWRALEYCRRSTPRGTRESLLAAMRTRLRRDVASHENALPAAA